MRIGLFTIIGLAILLGGCTAQIRVNPGEDGNGTTDNVNDNAGGGDGNVESQVAELRQFNSEDELRSYLVEQLERQNVGFVYSEDDRFDGPLPPIAAPGADEAPADSVADGGAPAPEAGDGDFSGGADDQDPYSGTTTQEIGVQEADVVKNDGTHIYILTGEKLKILTAEPLALVSSLPLEGYGQDLFMLEDRLVAITQPYDEIPIGPPPIMDGGGGVVSGGGGSGSSGEPSTDTSDPAMPPSGGMTEPVPADEPVSSGGDDAVRPDDPASLPPETSDVDGDVVVDVGIAYPDYGYYYRPQTRVTVIDITDHAAPSVLSTHTFHGSMASSRMIDRVMHLVLVNYPVNYYGMVPLGMPDASFQDVQLDTLMPKFQTVTAEGMVEGDVVKWDRFYAPVDPDGFGVTAVIRLDVDDPAEFNAVGIAAEPHIIYASTEALYVTDTAYTWWGDARETTDIYKFNYTDSGIELAAAGTVPGRIEDQYRMGEYNGYLRVATSTSQRFSMESGEELEQAGNHVFVLAEQEGSLAIVGAIRNIAPGEQIRAARFMGDRGILVTFRQIDPFFTLDLADPANPRIVADLKVPGFSTFMVPMDENHMLTVGQYVPLDGPAVPDGIQISIFDISDFANPVRSHNVIIAGQSTSSEAVWNPKAFTYFPERELLALPMEIYNYSSWWQEWDFARTEDGQEIAADDVASIDEIVEDESFTGLYVYHVTAEGGFELLGRMSTRDEANGYYYYNAFTRGVFMGDNVFAVTDNAVVGSPVSDVGSTPWKLTIGEQDNYYYDDIIYDDVVVSEDVIVGAIDFLDSDEVFDLFVDDFGLMLQ